MTILPFGKVPRYCQPSVTNFSNSASVTTLWPSSDEVNAIMKYKKFRDFQRNLEAYPHNEMHRLIGGEDTGGDMIQSYSPNDPLFWLHHANLDRLWELWRNDDPKKNPPNMNEALKPAPLITKKVSQVISTESLGYKYV